MSAESLFVADTLRLLAREGQRSWWSGRGASFALAEAFAASLRGFGADAAALPVEEFGARWPVAFVSRSGSGVPARSGLIVTEAEVAHALRVVGPGPLDSWWPGAWQRHALRAFASHLGLRMPVADNPRTDREVVLLTSSGWRAVAALVDAASAKVGPTRLVASSPGEFGHGLHARVAADARRWSVWLLVEAPHVRAWLRRYAPGAEVMELAGAPSPPVAPLRALDLALAHIGDTYARPALAAAADDLRRVS